MRFQPITVAILLTMISFSWLIATPEPSRAYVLHSPIRINSNSDFILANGVTDGNGSAVSPYLLEGWDISASAADAIYIGNTTASFIVRNVYLHDGGTSGGHKGIYLLNIRNGRVENSNISGDWYGIHLDFSSNLTVEGNTFYGNNNALQLWRSTGVTIRTNAFRGNLEYAIRLFELPNTLVVGNNISNNGGGINLSLTSLTNITDNDIWSNSITGIYADQRTNNVSILGNRIAHHSQFGIFVGSGRNFTLRANLLTGDGVYVSGASLPDFNTHIITLDNLVNGKPLRYLKNCNGVIVDGVPAGEVIVTNCTNVRVANLTLDNTDTGVELAFVHRALLGPIASANPGTLGYLGITGLWTSNVSVVNNTLASKIYSVIFSSSTNLTIMGDDISGGYYTVYLFNCSGARVHHNNFRTSPPRAYDDLGPENAWDNGYPSGGNYWSNYSGVDAYGGPSQTEPTGPDGFGDTPFVIDGNSRDRYPRMTPVGPIGPLPPPPQENQRPIAAFGIAPANPVVGQVVTFDASDSSDTDGQITSYTWDLGDGSLASGSNVTHAYKSSGGFTVTLTVTDNGSLTATVSHEVIISQPTPPPLAIGSWYFLGGLLLITSGIVAGAVWRHRKRGKRPPKA